MSNLQSTLGITDIFSLLFNQENQDENITYTINLHNIDVKAYASDYQLGPNANFQQYKEWALEKERKEAWQKAKLTRAGFSPLTTKADDSMIIIGDDLVKMQKELGDTIQSRHNDGFYYQYPFM